MRRTTIGIAVVLVALAAPAFAQETRFLSERSVTTAGQSSIRLAPDRAWVTVGIEARAPKPQDAQKAAAEVMTRIQNALKALMIPADAVRTVSFSMNADWDYSNNRRVLRGYVVSNLVEVKVDDLARVADVLDMSIAAGGNTIHGIRWDLQDKEKVERDALRRAVEDARQRAEVAVAAAGAKLGAVLRINEARYDSPRPMDMMMMRQEAAANAPPPPPTPISPGEIELRANVTVSFGIL